MTAVASNASDGLFSWGMSSLVQRNIFQFLSGKRILTRCILRIGGTSRNIIHDVWCDRGV